MERPEDFVPTFHVNYQSKLPWLHMDDDLEKFQGSVIDLSENPGAKTCRAAPKAALCALQTTNPKPHRVGAIPQTVDAGTGANWAAAH